MAVELEPVKVSVYELTLLGVEGADARLRAHCSGGTYMRSLAHDLGQLLGCGAHLARVAPHGQRGVRDRPGAHHRATGIAGRRRPPGGRHRAGRKDAARNAQRICGRCDGGADPPRPQLPGVAIPLRGGLALREGGDAAGRTWWPSEKRCCRICIIRWWCCRAGGSTCGPKSRFDPAALRTRASRTPSMPRPGATIESDRKRIFDSCDMIVKVKEPQPEEYGLLREGQILFTYLHLAADQRADRRPARAQDQGRRLRDHPRWPTAPCPASSR